VIESFWEDKTMPQITEIKFSQDQQRVYVSIDDTYCASIRSRTWRAMKLSVGAEITCEELKERENFFWKKAYGEKAWKEEKERLQRVAGWVKRYLPFVQVTPVGFGAASTELIPEHSSEKGSPDLSLSHKGREVIALEVSGTDIQRGQDFWVRPDKLEYAQNHPERDVWIVLHYRKPRERFIWIKPNLSKEYEYQEKEIREAVERYVVFDDTSEEVKSSEEFSKYVKQKIDNIRA
jgi:hypothetical protein